MRVEQFKVKNQFVIREGGKVIFQSYDSIIAEVTRDEILLYKDWDYSITTMKYLYMFLDEIARYYVNGEIQVIIDDILSSNNRKKKINKILENNNFIKKGNE